MSEVTLNLTLEHLNTGTRFAFYNMGIIKLYGLGDEEKNVDEAAEWFLRSEMPEGIHTYSIWLESKGEHEMALRFKNRARRMGFGEGEEEEEEDDEEEEEAEEEWEEEEEDDAQEEEQEEQ